jgi:hypothetical protein
MVTSRRIQSEAVEVCNRIQLAAQSDSTKEAIRRSHNREKLWVLSERVGVAARTFEDSLVDVPEATRRLLQQSADSIQESLRPDVKKALVAGDRFKVRVQMLHWQTLRATCARGGRYHSASVGYVDLVAVGVELLIQEVRDEWSTALDSQVSSIVKGVTGELENLVSDLAITIQGLLPELDDADLAKNITSILDRLVGTTSVSTEAVLRVVREVAEDTREKLLTAVREIFEEAMNQVFLSAASQRGPGMASRMREILGRGAAEAYVEASTMLRKWIGGSFLSMSGDIDKIVSELLLKTSKDVELLSSFFAPRDDEEDESEGIEEFLKIIESFLDSLRVMDVAETEAIETEADSLMKSQEGPIFVLDGSNLATIRISKKKSTSLPRLISCRDALKKEFPNSTVVVFVDPGFRHLLPESEKPEFEILLGQEEISQTPPRTEGGGDVVFLTYAERLGGIVVSNDTFSGWEDRFPFISKKGRILNASFVQGIWTFFSRRGS